MESTTTIEQVVNGLLPKPLNLERPRPLELSDTDAIAQQLRENALSVVTTEGTALSMVEALRSLCEELCLLPTYTAPIYLHGRAPEPFGYNTLEATPSGEHLAFETGAGQEFHTDATLQPIGTVRTTLLACERDAQEGGESTIFDCIGAFAELIRTDPAAAATLLEPRVLLRKATIYGSSEESYGPAFAIVDGQLMTRYSVGVTDHWMFDLVDDPEALRRAREFMAKAGSDSSPYVLEFLLEPGQILCFANSRLSHGRRPYRDSAARRRRYYRVLTAQEPQVAERSR